MAHPSEAEEKEEVYFGMRLRPEERERIHRLAWQRGTSAKQAVLDLISEALEEPVRPEPGSALDAAWDVLEDVGEGPPDLSTNPKYMEGFGHS